MFNPSNFWGSLHEMGGEFEGAGLFRLPSPLRGGVLARGAG